MNNNSNSPPPPPPPVNKSVVKKQTLVPKKSSEKVNQQQGSLLNAIKQRKAATEGPTPEELAKGTKYPINLYCCGLGNYGRLAQGDTINHINMIQAKCLTPIKLKKVACGAGHIIALDENGGAYTWGKCHFGQLGHGQLDTDRYLPTLVEALKGEKIVSISAGDSFTLAVNDKGNLYSWGCGYYGPLGHGNEETLSVPKIVNALIDKKVTYVAGGAFHTAVIVEGGMLYTFGRNNKGQLGLGDEGNRCVPVENKTVKNIKIIACGKEHTVCVGVSGDAYVWGNNENNQLGSRDQFEKKYLLPVVLPDIKDIISVAAGNFSTALLDKQGTLTLLGLNDKTVMTQLVSVSAGESHYLGIDVNGKLFTWGNGDYGKLGHRNVGWQVTEKQIITLPGKVISVAGGSNHSMVVIE
eukprot:TRINITY_DN15759_c0_g1_i1.p1 TRINITY_DN15759_c0_g1~~TRINITY_DN15759_c0_g1_i1.p1  ORF type:complete len:422 (+),score=96.10 TRINITY_DN15759_c0_g1_i1:37-1266(+)